MLNEGQRQMIKVCFITTIHNTLKGFVLKFAEYLHQETDWDITFICNADVQFEQSLPEYIHFIAVKMSRGVSVSGFSSMLELRKIFLREKFDLIQYSTPNASCYASLAGFLARVPIRLYCQWGLAFEGFSGVKRRIFMAVEKMTCRLSTWIEPDSNGNLVYCRKIGFYGENKSSIVLHGSACGVSFEKFDISQKEQYRKEIRTKFNIPDKAFVFGFVGSITGDKGINELMAASKELLSENEDIYVTIIGEKDKEYSLDSELLNWAEKETRFIFCGCSDAVEKNMAAMDCYVTASYREGFGTTVIEAGAMGLPVITSNIPGPTDAIKDGFNGLVVEKKNPAKLKEAMEKMYCNPANCQLYGENGYANVKEKYERYTLFRAMLEDRKRLLGIQ